MQCNYSEIYDLLADRAEQPQVAEKRNRFAVFALPPLFANWEEWPRAKVAAKRGLADRSSLPSNRAGTRTIQYIRRGCGILSVFLSFINHWAPALFELERYDWGGNWARATEGRAMLPCVLVKPQGVSTLKLSQWGWQLTHNDRQKGKQKPKAQDRQAIYMSIKWQIDWTNYIRS